MSLITHLISSKHALTGGDSKRQNGTHSFPMSSGKWGVTESRATGGGILETQRQEKAEQRSTTSK